MSRNLAWCLVTAVLVPVTALGQIRIATVANPTESTLTFTDANCSDTVTVRWTYTPIGVNLIGTGLLRLWASTACASGAGAGPAGAPDVNYTSAVNAYPSSIVRTGDFSVPLSNLPGFAPSTDGGSTVPCGAKDANIVSYICGAVDYSNGYSTQTMVATSLTMTYDTLAPAVPTINGAAGQDSAAQISFTAASDAVTVYATATSLDGGSSVSASGTASTGSLLIDGLTNDVTYGVTMSATDAVGNTSAQSDAVEVTPVQTNGFFTVLRNKGSTEEGNGCSTVGAAAFIPLAALGLLRALARRSAR